MFNKFVLRKAIPIVIGVMMIFFAQITLPILFDFQYDSRFTWAILGIVTYFSLVNLSKPTHLARNAFFYLAIFGTVIALIRPVQYALDEETHLKNAIGLSDSFLFKYSEEYLADYEAVFQHDAIRNAENYKDESYFERVEHEDSMIAGEPVGFDNPVYLPGTLGWNLGELISEHIQVSYYLGRIGTVLAYAALVFLAIKISLVYKEGIYLFGTLPSALYVTAGFHYDYLYYGASLLIIAMMTNILSKKQKVTTKRLVLLQALALLLVFAKFPYVLLTLLPLLLPQSYHEHQRIKWYGLAGFATIMSFAVIYSGIINLFPVTTFASSQSPGLVYFLTHPLPIVRTLLHAPTVIVDNFISRPLQYITADSGLLMTMMLIFFMVFYLIIAIRSRLEVPIRFQLLTSGLIFVIACLVIYAITGDSRAYNKGDIMVGGVQGRYYFFPLALFPIFLGDWLHRMFNLPEWSEQDNQHFTTLLQYSISFLMIFTISVALYTQL